MGDSELFKKTVLQSLHAIKHNQKDTDVFTCRNNAEKTYVRQMVKDKGLFYNSSITTSGEHQV